MKIDLNFNLEVDNEQINHIIKNGRNLFVELNEKLITITSLKKNNHKIILICDECTKKTQVKSLQQQVSKNKKYLCCSCRNQGELNGMYGKKHTIESRKKLSNGNAGKNNGFYGKKHTIESREKKSLSKRGLFSGEKNPMYGKSLLEIWIKKYGYDKAIKLWEKKYEKQSELRRGEKNPMYGKSILEIWIKKYGYSIAKKKYNNWVKNNSDGSKKYYENHPEMKKHLSDVLKGRKFTNEHRKNLRISTINHIRKRLELNGDIHTPAFNINACELFDKISEILNVNIQHALNGGEYHIKDLGYWVDGYDKINNVIYEYYERFHKYKTKKDLKRENEIKKHLNCKFVIIWEGGENKFINEIINNNEI